MNCETQTTDIMQLSINMSCPTIVTFKLSKTDSKNHKPILKNYDQTNKFRVLGCKRILT